MERAHLNTRCIPIPRGSVTILVGISARTSIEYRYNYLFTLESHTVALRSRLYDDVRLQKYKKILKPAQFCRKFFIYAPQTLKDIANGFLIENGEKPSYVTENGHKNGQKKGQI